jgi:Ca2+-transporting ATPase
MRSRDRGVLQTVLEPNPALWWITAGALAALAVAIYVPAVAQIFRFSPLGAPELAVAAGAGVAGLALQEAWKLIAPRRARAA